MNALLETTAVPEMLFVATPKALIPASVILGLMAMDSTVQVNTKRNLAHFECIMLL